MNSVALSDLSEVLFQSIVEGLIVANRAGKILIANEAAHKLFAYPNNQLIGRKVEDLIPSSIRAKHKQHRENYNQKPSQRTMGAGLNLVGLRKDNSTFPIEISLNHFTHNNEALVVALISDISRRKRTEDELLELKNELERKVLERTKALKESQKLYQEIAKNFPNGAVSVVDKELKILFIDGKDISLQGLDPDMLKGEYCLSSFSEPKQKEYHHKLMSCFNHQNVSFEVDYNNTHYLVNAVPIYDSHQEISSLLLATHNISKLKKAEADMKASMQKEIELSEMKSRFVSMASHEFRTPLTSVLNSASLLSKYTHIPNSAEKQEKHIEKIKNAVKHLTSILNDFLSIDKLSTGKIELNYQTINLPEYTQEIVRDVQDFAKKGQQINYVHTGDTNVVIDQQVLKILYYNMLSNAVKYSEENQPIKLSTALDNDELKIIIADEGRGIPEDEHNQVFSRFFRATNVSNIQGTGLGLNIVQKYVELSGGTIKFESEYEKGTIFTITLPTNKKVSPPKDSLI